MEVNVARKCSICASDKEAEINLALVEGKSHRRVADAYRCSPSAVDRHASSHLPEALSRAAARTEDLRHDRVLGRLAALVDEGEEVLGQAREKGSDPRLVLAALREVRETLCTLAKLTEPRFADPEIEVLVRALGRVLPAYPDTALALAIELDALGARDAAQVIGFAASRYVT